MDVAGPGKLAGSGREEATIEEREEIATGERNA
jgi:hypothetical protein